MSLVLAGRRRVCVLVLFSERLRNDFAAVRRGLSLVGHALDAGFAMDAGTAERRSARVVLSARVHRRWGRSLFGLSFFVIALEPPAPGAAQGMSGVSMGTQSGDGERNDP